jgi:hypothetical protein
MLAFITCPQVIEGGEATARFYRLIFPREKGESAVF